MSDQYVTTQSNQYQDDAEPKTPVTPLVSISTANLGPLTQELQNLKFKHVRLQQQHVNLANQIVQLQRTSGSSASYE